jgi:putative membrane protein
MYWVYDHYWGMNFIWWVFWVVLAITLLFTGWPRSRMTSGDRAIEMLRTRYAAGEIDEAEYRARLAVLRGVARDVAASDTRIRPAV